MISADDLQKAAVEISAATSAIRFRIHPQERLVWFRVEGKITIDQLIEGIYEVGRHPEFHPAMDTFVDMEQGGVSFSEARPGSVASWQEFFHLHRFVRDGVKWAILTQDAATLEAVMSVHQVEQGSEISVQVFTLRDAALLFLDREDPRSW